ncbi:MAG: M48 family metallopeptidase [Bdellovibrionota bacterium]
MLKTGGSYKCGYGSFLSVACLVIIGCATSPLGRKQLILVPDAQMDSLGAQAFQQMKAKTPISSDPAINAYVKCVAKPLTEAAKDSLHVSNWEIIVFKDDTANAFALPGGKIGVHTGIFKVAKTQSQLAAVIGHEVGHVIAKHGAERVSDTFATQGALQAIGALTGDNPNGKLIIGLLGLGAQVGVLLPFGRTQESEADLIGLDLMSRSGFDPRESITLWQNMKSFGGGAPPEWLSTHPAHDTRIADLNTNMPDATRRYERARSQGRDPKCQLPPDIKI